MNLKKRSFFKTIMPPIGQILADLICIPKKTACIINIDRQISLMFSRNFLVYLIPKFFSNELVSSLLFGANGFLNFEKNNAKQFLITDRVYKAGNATADNICCIFC